MRMTKKEIGKRLLRCAAALCIGAVTLLLCAAPVFAGDGKGNTEPEKLHTDSPLYEKKALFCGDSICAAAVFDYSNMNRWGWAGRIARDYGMSYTNKGLDGASVSNVRGDNTILAQLQSAKGKTYDFVILQGGTNDGWDNAPVGEMTAADKKTGFDPSTFAGGLETLFSYAKRSFPTAKIGYIINYQTPTKAYGTLDDMSAYYDLAKKICDKWEIPYLDLYNNAEINQKVLQMTSGRFAGDKIHLNGRGYDRIYPYIAAFMEQLVTEDASSENAGGEANSPDGVSEALPSDDSAVNAGEKEKDKNDDLSFLWWLIPLVLVVVVAGAVVIIKRK